MDYQKLDESNCRICLQENVVVDWNDFLQDHDHLTYKDCYYKYTQLDCFDDNNAYLSTMLCRDCSNGLENIHTFITKAMETHNFLQERLAIQYKEENDSDLKTNFETILISETYTDIKPDIQNCNLYEDTRKESLDEESEETESSIKHVSILEAPSKECLNEESEETEFSLKHVSMLEAPSKECLIEESNYFSITEFNESSIKHVPTYEANTKEYHNEESDSWNITKDNEIKQSRKRKSVKEECKQDNTKSFSEELQSDTTSLKNKRHCSKPWEIPTCCSICSKVLASKYKAIQHEQIHAKNRERNQVCAECGMKFYNKPSLNSHMLTHIKNREKTYKCEFCDKAFYNCGGLNIHRRIHLGQMIKCNLCTKEYYRQVDLDKHMISHSATRISEDLKSKKKYFICCEICEVSIPSSQYKSHSAKHMNEPLAKCAICNKEFFSRESCVSHLKNFHKKASGERSNFVISYNTTRYSNLFLQQNVGKIYTKE